MCKNRVKSSLEFTQTQVEELITSDLRVKEVKVQIEDLGNKLDDLENRSRRNNLCFEGIPESPNETWQESESKIKHLISINMPEGGTDFSSSHHHRPSLAKLSPGFSITRIVRQF